MGFNCRDFISEIKIIDSTFKLIEVDFPDTTLIPIQSAYNYPSSEAYFDFMGANSLTVSGNQYLNTLDMGYRSFRVTDSNNYGYYPQRNINIRNNPNLSSVNLVLSCRGDYPGEYDYNWENSGINTFNITLEGNNNIKNITVLGKELTSYSNSRETIYPDNARDYKPVQVFLNLTYETTLSLENIDIQYPGNHTLYTQFNNASGNILLSVYDFLSSVPSSYHQPYLEYGGWNRFKAGNNINTLSSFKQISLDKAFKTIYKNKDNENTEYIANDTLFFVTASASTLVDILTTNAFNNLYAQPKLGTCLFTSESIPAEILHKHNVTNNQYQVFQVYNSNPNTLFAYQSRIITEALSGKVQPWTFYRPVTGDASTGHRSINPNFGFNKNSTYTWPLSILNNINRMANYQGPFSNGTFPCTLIHPRYAYTAEHWQFGKSFHFPYNTSFFNTDTGINTSVTVITSRRIGPDIRIMQFQTPLPLSSFPGLYILPQSLYSSNSATKIATHLPGFSFGQFYDITPSMFRLVDRASVYGRDYINFDSTYAAFLSQRNVIPGDSGHPQFTFINNKPVIIGGWTSIASGDALGYYYQDIQSTVNLLEGSSVALNLITQADLDIYDNYIY
jgi:hypothetical protein